MFGGTLPVHEGILPSLPDPMGAGLNLPEQGHDPLLERRPARGQDGRGLGQVLVIIIIIVALISQ